VKVLIFHPNRSNAMNEFVQRNASSVIGALSGFDRLLFRGTLRRIANAAGLSSFLSYTGVLLKDFGGYSMELTERVKNAALAVAAEMQRPVLYLPDPSVRKEDVAREIAKRDGIDNGLICVLSAVEPCWSFEIHRNRAAGKLELRSRQRRCLHLYHYMIHPQLGFLHARLQTWLPFTLSVCMNGREWLSRQMDQAGLGYVRRENCFADLADVGRAQSLMDAQLKTDWKSVLDGIAAAAHPAHAQLFGPQSNYPIDPYWSVQQSEWATDVMFKSPQLLASLYPRLIRQGIETMGSRDVLRFLGKRVPEGRNAHANFNGQVLSDLKDRPEGLRLKHAVNGNSVKMYDKQGSVLRFETTINQTREFKVFRGTEDEPDKKQWRPLRKGVADLHRRAQVSQSSNDRYMKEMAAVQQTTPLKDLAQPLCVAVRKKGRRARALNPLSSEDASLLQAVARGEFVINGFRNRDIRALLYTNDANDKPEARRRSAAVGRRLRLLRAHGLIRKVPRTHRYQVSDKGRLIITALLAAGRADASTLAKAA
jgi:hypothetical protein